MSRILIENSRVWQEDGFVAGRTLVLCDGVIAGLLPEADVAPQPGDRRIDGRGAYTLPGFVDLHIHGSMGFDVMDASPASLTGLCDFLARGGVTSFLATTMTDSAERIHTALKAVEEFAKRAHRPLVGLHIEGPYLNTDYRGSQPAAHLREPQAAEYRPWLESGLVKLITLAPEIAGGESLMRDALAHGATVSIGHSGADYEAAGRYFAAGASQVTHTFNGMPGIHHRQPGLFVAALENPDVTFQLIPDGIHVHPAVIRMLTRLVGIERVVVITDAMRAAGLGDGEYAAVDGFVTVKKGEARTSDGGLAGSTLTLEGALKNMMRFCGLTLEEALPMLTRAPARSIGMYPQKGSLAVGADADVILWDEALGVQATLIGGELVYQAQARCTAAIADD
ncbi:MAG: N-acetylglucosamine-6-phosphate deacetylase [Chloroflexi bacterium]|nr:N-acetylglucosamine-6-phosphate deacetylase [Chloroflexota bacterium]